MSFSVITLKFVLATEGVIAQKYQHKIFGYKKMNCIDLIQKEVQESLDITICSKNILGLLCALSPSKINLNNKDFYKTLFVFRILLFKLCACENFTELEKNPGGGGFALSAPFASTNGGLKTISLS